jgi:DNA-directed RNA polymerase subunit RPC12/RpoP
MTNDTRKQAGETAMPTSFGQTPQLTCPQCGQPFQAEIWLIVDADERPDLLEKIQAGTLHQIACPHCRFERKVALLRDLSHPNY